MTRKMTTKVAIVIAGLVLAATAAAAAGDPPEAADDGLSTAEEHSGAAVPASKDDHPTKDDHPGGGDEELTVEAEGVGPVDNHGAEVSAVAQDDSTTGREHGEAVSEVARGDHGQPEGERAPNENAAPQASLGADNAGDDGTP